MVAGVGDDQEPPLGEPVDEEVIDHAAALVAEQAVLRAALGDAANVARDQTLHALGGSAAADHDLTHVRDVENADV